MADLTKEQILRIRVDEDGPQGHIVKLCDMALRALSPEVGALEALKLAKDWIEESEDQTMEEAVRSEARFKERGSIGYNQKYIAMCEAVLQALSQPQKDG